MNEPSIAAPRNLKRTLLVFAVALLAFTGDLFWCEIVKINIRFAIMVQDMTMHGVKVFPTVNGAAYTDYFSPMVFFSYLTSGGGRWINMFTLVLPTMLFAAYTVAMIFRTGELFRTGMGKYAALFFFLGATNFDVSRSFGVDVPVMAAAVTILYLLMRRDRSGKQGGVGIVLSLLFAFAVRGPLGIVLCGALLAGYLLVRMEWKRILLWGVLGAATLALGLGALYWLIQRQGGEALWEHFIKLQFGNRIGGTKQPLYYFTEAIGAYAPLYPVALVVLILNFRKLDLRRKAPDDDQQFLRALAGCWLLPLLILSVPGAKHMRYMMPVVPVLCLAAGYGVACAERYPYGVWVRRILAELSRYVLVLTLAFTVIFAICSWIWAPEIDFPLYFPLVVLAALGALSYRRLKCLAPEDADRRLFWQLFQFAAGFGIAGMLVYGAWDTRRESSRDFVQMTEAVAGDAPVYLCNMGPDHDDLKYLLHCPPKRHERILYLFEDDPGTNNKEHYPGMYRITGLFDMIDTLPSGTIFVTRKKYISEVVSDPKRLEKEFTMLHSGNLGHREFVAFRKN